MTRKPRIKSATGVYHVLVRAIADIDLIADQEDSDIYTGILRDLQDKGLCTVYAYALFPTHVHLLIKAQPESTTPSAPSSDLKPINSVMKRIAVTYSYYFNVKYEHYGPIYLDRFKSEPITSRPIFLHCLHFIADQATEHKGILTHTIPTMSDALHCDGSPTPPTLTLETPFIDYATRPKRITDSRLLHLLQSEHHFTTPEEFLQRPDPDKTHVIVSTSSVGASIRQLARLTGLTPRVVIRMASKK